MNNQIIENDLMKRCCRCGIFSLKSISHKNTLIKDGCRSACKNCEKKNII